MIYCFYCFLSSPAGSTTRDPGALGTRAPGVRAPRSDTWGRTASRGWGGPGAVPATGVSRVGRSRAIPGVRAGPALSRASCHPGPPLRASPLRAMAAVAWGRCLPRVWLLRRTGPGCGRHYRAALCAELKHPLAIEEVASRPVRPHEVRVDVHFCGVNFADILVCRGQYQEKPQLPFTPGMEFSGTVLETGTDVSTVKEGDRVIGVSRFNGMAEECIIDHKTLWQIPEGVPLREAATLPVSYVTAILALEHRACTRPGETVLVTAAAGATGLAVIDVATNVLQAKPGLGGQDCGGGFCWRNHCFCAGQPSAPEECLCYGAVLGPIQRAELSRLLQNPVLCSSVLPARAHPATHRSGF
ncbi:quinone oxidoreductase-like protein 2 isoform X8 [Felis catus]|uniref:quinone oxidoreductase-like protein 2 isoform X8 n=1 Tax=Felis catus TaxID=9685 RepID=UPI001D1991D9|nr:quinone oxidoreductase-like protein 2 isoform X8 [Felis catus]XP_044904474.1 quinone oxidoreductase-like protein 2 isoform X8 [Felis catus]